MRHTSFLNYSHFSNTIKKRDRQIDICGGVFDEKSYRFFATIFLTFILFGCGKNIIERPETNLEFWICDNADNIDFSGYQERYGLWGGREYYGSGYAPSLDENGQQIDPEKCVIYTVTSYPDYSSKTHHITNIAITDPEVNVYGLTVNSSEDEIKTSMLNNGFKLVNEGFPQVKSFRKGDVFIRFTNSFIQITVEVSNKHGIVF